MDIRLSTTPVIALVGRTNVGKSTLFNRLIERRKAITSPTPGTTRDISFGHCHWRSAALTIIDTAGLDLTSSGSTEDNLRRQAKMAMDKADVILFVTDVNDGAMPQDVALARELKKSRSGVLLVTNKADNPAKRRLADSNEWLRLGFGEPLPVSATNGSGVGDMLDAALAALLKKGRTARPLPDIDARVAIIGRPNVGKSSLLNGLAGEERVIVSEIPFTTKEPQDTLLAFEDETGAARHLLLIDTVGLRKRARVAPGIERLGVQMSLSELERADATLLVVDAADGIGVQEKKLAGLVEEKATAVVIVVNKWDLSPERNLGSAENYKKYVAAQLPFFDWAPVMFISAKTGHRVGRVLTAALAAKSQRERVISQEELDAFKEKLIKLHHSAFRRGQKRPKVYGLTQSSASPPTFMLVVHDRETLHPNFIRFVENRLRDEFGFAGTPIRVRAREKMH